MALARKDFVPPARWGQLLVGSGSAIALVGTFLPWLASGAVDRSSYDLIDLIERLGFSPDGVVGLATRLWPVVPVLLVVAGVGQLPVLRHHRRAIAHVADVVAVVAACYVGGTALAVLAAPDVSLFRVRAGVATSLVGVVLLLAGTTVSRLADLRPGRPTGLDR